jgi:hypothetical protein
MPAHSRDQVTRPARAIDRLPQIHGLQTTTGFSLQPGPTFGEGDPRSVVAAVEPGSAAADAGIQPGDRIVGLNGEPNRIVVELVGSTETVTKAVQLLVAAGGTAGVSETISKADTAGTVSFNDTVRYDAAVKKLLPRNQGGPAATAHDYLWELARDWPRGVNTLSLVVERNGQQIPLSFVPRTVPFYPTQLYETVSMLLLIGLLLSFQPFRRHDGQVMVVFMVGYSVHRFFNEAIRIEPTYALGLTLSQWISVGMLTGAVLLELYLRMTQPRLPAGALPLSHGQPQE